MINSLHLSSTPFHSEMPTLNSGQPSSVEAVAAQQFSQMAKMSESPSFWQPLLENPGEILIGGMWAFILAINAYYAVESLFEFHQTLTAEHAASEKFEKIGSAIKKAFVNITSLSGSAAYTAHWAHEANLIVLGQYASLFKGFGLGGSLIVGGVESGAAIYQIHSEKEAIQKERSPVEKERHKQYLCLALMKLIGNVSMVAWTALGIATIALGISLSPILASALLGVSCIFATATFFYERKLENHKEWFPYPNIRRQPAS